MRIEILETREYRPFGLRFKGEQLEVADGIGHQLVTQGFARELPAEEPSKDVKYNVQRRSARKYSGGN